VVQRVGGPPYEHEGVNMVGVIDDLCLLAMCCNLETKRAYFGGLTGLWLDEPRFIDWNEDPKRGRDVLAASEEAELWRLLDADVG